MSGINPQGQAILKWNSSSTGIASLTNIEFSGSTGEIDCTNNDTMGGANDVVPGVRDRGKITCDFVATSGNAATLETDWKAKTVAAFDVLFWTSGLHKTGTAFISDYSITAELKGESVVEGSITFRIVTETTPS